MKILLVEDHADSAAVVARMLRMMGHQARSASNCAEAASAVVEEAFDLLLCDLTLPDGDGCELMRDLRDRYGMEGVAMTGHDSAEDRERCRAAGFSRFLAKPFDLNQLRAAVEGEG